MQSSYKVIKKTHVHVPSGARVETCSEVTIKLKAVSEEGLGDSQDDVVNDAHCEAAAIVAKANEMAERTLLEAEKTAVELKEKGYAEGYQSGLSEVQEVRLQAEKEAQQIITEAENFRQQSLEELKGDIKNLALQIVRKVIMAEVELKNGLIENIVSAVVDRVKDQQRIHIFVNPRDVQTVEDFRTTLFSKLGQVSLQIYPDPVIELGGCRINTENGWIDATLDSQLKEIEVQLRQV